jgi:hypothetical protein
MGAELTLWNDVPTPKISAVGHPNVNAPEVKIEIVRLGLTVSADADADKKWNRLSPWQFVEDVLSKLKSRTEGPAT